MDYVERTTRSQEATDYAYFYSLEYAQDLDTHLKDDFEAHCDIFNATLLLV